MPAGDAGTSYSQTLTVTGGGVPYTSFTISQFSAGTTGLSIADLAINATARTLTIKGTPTAWGTATFTVHVVDAAGAVLNKAYTLTIHGALTVPPSLPAGTADTSYDHAVTIAGGSTPYKTVSATGFSAGTTGLTAAAISVNTAAGTIVIDGTPTAAGTATFTANVTDAAGAAVTRTYSLTINAALTLGSLTTTQWTAIRPGYTGAISIAGGTGPFVLAGVSGMPTGLTAAVSGTTIHVTGRPTIAGTYTVGVTIHDAAGASVTKTFRITINHIVTIGTLTASQWTTDMPGFNGMLTVSGGTGGYAIAAASGLPVGLKIALTGGTIHFTGTPTTLGVYAGSVTIRDADGASDTRTFTITINAAPTLGNLTTAQWTEGKTGFSGVIPIAAGTGPFRIYSFSGMPVGLTPVVSGDAIHFTGTPTTTTTYTTTITLHDAAGASVTRVFRITINPPVEITTTSLPSEKAGVLYTAAVHAREGTGAITFAITAGSLPPGMKLSSSGVISGESARVGSYTFTITATDAVGATASEKYTLALS